MSEKIRRKRNFCKWCEKTDHLRKSSKLCSHNRLLMSSSNEIEQSFPRIMKNVLSEIKELKKSSQTMRKCKRCNGTDHSMITSKKCPFHISYLGQSKPKRLQSKAKPLNNQSPVKDEKDVLSSNVIMPEKPLENPTNHVTE